jgi:hypothetical protein
VAILPTLMPEVGKVKLAAVSTQHLPLERLILARIEPGRRHIAASDSKSVEYRRIFVF